MEFKLYSVFYVSGLRGLFSNNFDHFQINQIAILKLLKTLGESWKLVFKEIDQS